MDDVILVHPPKTFNYPIDHSQNGLNELLLAARYCRKRDMSPQGSLTGFLIGARRLPKRKLSSKGITGVGPVKAGKDAELIRL